MKDKEFAVVDIGSNSLRLMTGRWEDDRWKFSAKELETTRLGYQIEETRHLSPEGIEASLAAMARWQARLGSVPVCAVATSAVREAADGNTGPFWLALPLHFRPGGSGSQLLRGGSRH